MATINNGYLNLEFNSDKDTLIQSALANIAKAVPGWRPREGNLEVLLLEQFAEMAAEAASVAAQVPLAIFSYYGSLLGLSQNGGIAAVVSTTWKLAVQSVNPTTFVAGTKAAALINNVYYQFELIEDLVIPANTSSATGNMQATESGSSYNAVYNSDIYVTSYLQPLYSISNLASIQITSLIASGVDAENDTNYFNRLANSLSLYTSCPILPSDYAALATQVAGVGRATAYNNTNAFFNQFSYDEAFPQTTGWFSAGGTVVANSSNPAGVKITMPSTMANASFTSGPAVVGQSIIPLVTTSTTAGATVTAGATTTVAITSSTGWGTLTNGGVGFVYGTDGAIHAFTYTSITTTTINGAIFFESFTYASTAAIAYGGTWISSGATGFWAGFGHSTGQLAINHTNIAGMAMTITQGSISETVVSHNVITYGSIIAIDVLTFVNTYSASAFTVTICPGASTAFDAVSSNGINMLATAQVQAPPVTLTLSAASYATGTFTYTGTSVNTYLTAGEVVSVSGFSNNAYNLSNVTIATVTSTTFTITKTTTPGSSSGGGIATLISVGNSVPIITAVVTYANDLTPYTYANDVTMVNEYANIPSCVSTIMKGINPNTFTSTNSGLVPADTNINVQNFKTNINSIKVNIYWNHAVASQSKYILLAAVYNYNENYSYPSGGAWYEVFDSSGNFNVTDGAPGNMLPDAQFQSVFSGIGSTTYTGSNATVTSLSSGIPIASLAYWPTSGVGTLSANTSSAGTGSVTTHYFSYTGITVGVAGAGTLTGVTIVGSSSDYILTNAAVTCLAPNNSLQQWFFNGLGYGTPYPLPGQGLQFLPGNNTMAGKTTIDSSIFSLPYANNGNYVLDVIIDASYVSSSSYLPTVTVYSAATGTVISSGSSVAQATGATGTKARITKPFSISSNTDVYVEIAFPANMATANGQSIVISNINILPLAGTMLNVTGSYAFYIDSLTGPQGPGPYWTPGGVLSSNQERNVTVAVTDSNGLTPSLTVIDTAQNYLANLRELNFQVNVVGPTYVPVAVYYSVNAASNYDESTIKQNILAELLTILSPYNWGGGSMSPPIWDSSENTIRYLNIAGAIDDSTGVTSLLSLQIGFYGSALGTSDLTMNGLACLPVLAQVTGQINRSSSTIYEISAA